MKILYIAYPLLPVSDTSAGGAEQVLWTLEREVASRGHETVVAACAGSKVAGRLFATGSAPSEADTLEHRNREHQEQVFELLQNESFDMIHDHSGSFFAAADRAGMTVLATLHLPRNFYPGVNFGSIPSNVVLNCVSEAQRATFEDVPRVAGAIPNGIAVERFPFQPNKDGYLLWLGRFCEEKGPHLAIEAAKLAGRRLVLAGQVYPFTYHRSYFQREIAPRLGPDVELVDSPDWARKTALLAYASALLVSSTAEETSSLVALEAMACGTPVIAFRRGALPEIVQHLTTGYLVEDVSEMARAVHRLNDVSPLDCRDWVARRNHASCMTDGYLRLYRRLMSAAAVGLPPVQAAA